LKRLRLIITRSPLLLWRERDGVLITDKSQMPRGDGEDPRSSKIQATQHTLICNLKGDHKELR
jgi:hypothetical protein